MKDIRKCETCNELYEYNSMERRSKLKNRRHCPNCMALPFKERVKKWKNNLTGNSKKD